MKFNPKRKLNKNETARNPTIVFQTLEDKEEFLKNKLNDDLNIDNDAKG
jgi:hypothetical protein